MKTLNDIINWIIQSGLLVWLFYFGFALGKPWIDSKIKHAKTQQQREAWALLEQVAMTTVNSLVSSSKTGQQKFDEASTQVASYLSDHGIKMDMDTIQSAVQAAYEKSPLTAPSEGKEVDTPIKAGVDYTPVASTPAPANDDVIDALMTAPNRANDVKEG